VQTNIVVFGACGGALPTRRRSWRSARADGVWVNALGPRTIRALTHRDVTREQCCRAAEVLVRAAEARR
jgi:threonine aldolase